MSEAIDKDTHPQDELSIWELLSLFLKNWIPVCIIIFLALLGSIIYSFVIKEQPKTVTTCKISKMVIYEDWDYYPPGFKQTYIESLTDYVKEKSGGSFISKATLRDNDTEDEIYEYHLNLTYSSSTTKDQAEILNQYVIEWHNTTIQQELDRIIANKEQELDNLYIEYEKAEQEYNYFLYGESDMSTESILKSNRDVSFELWKSKKIELQDIKDEVSNISEYYLDKLNISLSTTTSTNNWKQNIIISLILGFVISVVFVLMKESYSDYKLNKSR